MASSHIETYSRNLLFPIGALVFSAGIDQLVRAGRLDPMPYFRRHTRGDWGEVSDQQWQANNAALQSGASLESHYVIHPGWPFASLRRAAQRHRHRVAVRGLSTVHPQATQARTFNRRPRADSSSHSGACHCPAGGGACPFSLEHHHVHSRSKPPLPTDCQPVQGELLDAESSTL
jgi:hypothetical protein